MADEGGSSLFRRLGLVLWSLLGEQPLWARMIEGAVLGMLIAALGPAIIALFTAREKAIKSEASVYIECNSKYWSFFRAENVADDYRLYSFTRMSGQIFYGVRSGPAETLVKTKEFFGVSPNIITCEVRSLADSPLLNISLTMQAHVREVLKKDSGTTSGKEIAIIPVFVSANRIDKDKPYVFYLVLEQLDAYIDFSLPKTFEYTDKDDIRNAKGKVISSGGYSFPLMPPSEQPRVVPELGSSKN